MRRNIEFNADGVTLRGWLYVPEGTQGSSDLRPEWPSIAS